MGPKRGKRGAHLAHMNKAHPRYDGKRSRDWVADSDDEHDADFDLSASDIDDNSDSESDEGGGAPSITAARRKQQRDWQERSRKRRKREERAPPRDIRSFFGTALTLVASTGSSTPVTVSAAMTATPLPDPTTDPPADPVLVRVSPLMLPILCVRRTSDPQSSGDICNSELRGHR